MKRVRLGKNRLKEFMDLADRVDHEKTHITADMRASGYIGRAENLLYKEASPEFIYNVCEEVLRLRAEVKGK